VDNRGTKDHPKKLAICSHCAFLCITDCFGAYHLCHGMNRCTASQQDSLGFYVFSYRLDFYDIMGCFDGLLRSCICTVDFDPSCLILKVHRLCIHETIPCILANIVSPWFSVENQPPNTWSLLGQFSLYIATSSEQHWL
jgi:hypothetical protein